MANTRRKSHGSTKVIEVSNSDVVMVDSEIGGGESAASTPSSAKKRMRSNQCTQECSPMKVRSPVKCVASPCKMPPKPNVLSSPKKLRKCLAAEHFESITKWDPKDPMQIKAVKEALHVATAPHSVICRELEQNKIMEFCKLSIKSEKAGSLYICGCPGTGKTLSINRVQEDLRFWSKEEGVSLPEVLAVNCTSLTKTTEIFSKILAKLQPLRNTHVNSTPLQCLQNLFSQNSQTSSGKMILIVADEMDYLITKDRAVLHDLFMLTTLPFSKCILIGIANAIDLANRFLPKLESLNCKPAVITFRAYSKEEILKIIHQRLKVIGYDVFQPLALEFCARKVAAASGDMRKALAVCRSAVEVLEEQLKRATENQEYGIVTFDQMDTALSKAFKSPVVDIIQSLPQHQQIVLCSIVKLFNRTKKNATTVGELNGSYIDVCKATQIPPVGMLEFGSICTVLNDQGLVQLSQSKVDKLKRVTLKVDRLDVMFAFKGMRFFQNCLE